MPAAYCWGGLTGRSVRGPTGAAGRGAPGDRASARGGLPARSTARKMKVLIELKGGHVLILLTFISLINFLVRCDSHPALRCAASLNSDVSSLAAAQDRMIIAGAPIQFGAFITQALDVPMSEESFWLGCLSSSFLASFATTSIAFGHLMHFVPQFRLLSFGIFLWVVALAGCGFAYWMPRCPATFWFFLGCRALSGVGGACRRPPRAAA